MYYRIYLMGTDKFLADFKDELDGIGCTGGADWADIIRIFLNKMINLYQNPPNPHNLPSQLRKLAFDLYSSNSPKRIENLANSANFHLL